MSAPDEIRAAAEAAIRVGLPYTYTGLLRHGRPHHDGPAAEGHPRRRRRACPRRPLGVGANCGVGASDILASLLDMTEAKPDATVIVKGNCGIPEFRGTEIHYSGTPELMADYVRLAVDGGAKIVGGCCGTSFAPPGRDAPGARRAQEGRAPDRRDDRRAHRPDAQQAGDGQHGRDQRSAPRAPPRPEPPRHGRNSLQIFAGRAAPSSGFRAPSRLARRSASRRAAGCRPP